MNTKNLRKILKIAAFGNIEKAYTMMIKYVSKYRDGNTFLFTILAIANGNKNISPMHYIRVNSEYDECWKHATGITSRAFLSNYTAVNSINVIEVLN